MLQCILPRRAAGPPLDAGRRRSPAPRRPRPRSRRSRCGRTSAAPEQAREALRRGLRRATPHDEGAPSADDVVGRGGARPSSSRLRPAHVPVAFVDEFAGETAAEPPRPTQLRRGPRDRGHGERRGVSHAAHEQRGRGGRSRRRRRVTLAPCRPRRSSTSRTRPSRRPSPCRTSDVVPPTEPPEPATTPAPAAPAAAKPAAAPREVRPQAPRRRPARAPCRSGFAANPPARPARPARGRAGRGDRSRGAAKAARSGPPMLLIGGVVGVLVLVVGGLLAWRALGSGHAAARPDADAGRAREPRRRRGADTGAGRRDTGARRRRRRPRPRRWRRPPPVVSSTPTPAATPTPTPTPTPRATPTPAAAAATPPPATTGPSPDQVRAQQVAGLVGQAEAAIGARQYDAALGHARQRAAARAGQRRATSLRADAAQKRDLARRRFVPGRTVVDSEKTRKDKASGGLVGFDADDKAPDFTGRIEFEMSPAGAVEANDAWTLKVFVVNQGAKPIKVQERDDRDHGRTARRRAPVDPERARDRTSAARAGGRDDRHLARRNHLVGGPGHAHGPQERDAQQHAHLEVDASAKPGMKRPWSSATDSWRPYARRVRR